MITTLLVTLAFALTAASGPASAQTVAIDDDDIGGVVMSQSGPEAGVWVIAETKDFETRFIKAVVTDDQGRYVLPDLPPANYDVWVRGYGLVDSPKMRTGPGKTLNLTAVLAPDDATAAQYYPAIHWYSMLGIPGEDEFGSNGDMPEDLTQADYIGIMSNRGCVVCHQLGQLATRTIPEQFGTGTEGWIRRTQSGQAGGAMTAQLAGTIGNVPYEYFGAWTDRIAAGELPHTKPVRPMGEERNIVVTVRDWLNDKQYLHDLISTDKRNPTVNAYGPVYGSPEYSTDDFPVLDPLTNKAWTIKGETMPGTTYARASHALAEPAMPSAYWGDETIWNSRSNNHNPMFDDQGRVWYAARVRNEANPDYCKAGSDHPSAILTPLNRSGRQLSFYDPKTEDYVLVDTCFGTHHLQFGLRENSHMLYTSGGGSVFGWIDAKKFLETRDAESSMGWSAMVLDTNGNGKRDEGYLAPNDAVDPTKDKRVFAGLYAVMPSPLDGSVWGTAMSNKVVRIAPGANPPETTLTEVYNIPAPYFGPRGGDIDSEGVVWVSLGSGHLGSFDRRKCKGPLNGPEATGDHCPEGWNFYQYPGPGFKGIGPNSAEASYYSWVDQHNTFGLGKDVPMSTGNLNDGLIALKDDKMITMRVPYPMGFYAKGLDGRIDDAQAGWKGRGLWTTSGDRTPWMMEGGKGSKPLVVHFQLRPDPLAK
ncbi:MAG: carboxypeptidase regulatory-like domain-containing protein [Kordiimonadaceae bacterium]|nr:carboxypeptidase regulatory-like domain-containing protein [Kordiimonadaceae bacterium]